MENAITICNFHRHFSQLLINPAETKFMLIETRKLMSSHSVDLSYSFMALTPVDSARDLGVIIDSHLTYDSHISYLVSSRLSKASPEQPSLEKFWQGHSNAYYIISCIQ